MSVPTLPHDIISEILTKLPVKALLRFRCVCKSWNSIVSDPQFSKLHRKRPCLFLYGLGPFNFTTYNYEALIADRCDDNAVTQLYVPWERHMKTGSDGCCAMVGSCDGLICLLGLRLQNLTFWNPSTRQFKTAPLDPCILDGLSCYGFGYDKLTDDYKVVVTNDRMKIQMFSMKSNNWKRIPERITDTQFVIPSEYGTFLDGALHWLAFLDSSSDVYRQDIAAFDLAEEKFEILLAPDLDFWSYRELGVLGGLLSLCSQHPEAGRRGRTDVWIMKEYGVQSSWTKLFTVPQEIMGGYSYTLKFCPLVIAEKGEIVGLAQGDEKLLVRFNIQNLHLQTLLNRPLRFTDVCVGPLLHMESLVSLY